MTIPKFKEGQEVEVVLTGGGFVTSEFKTVLKVNDKGVFLDNGNGNDPDGPFDPVSGFKESYLPGWTTHIKAVPNEQ